MNAENQTSQGPAVKQRNIEMGGAERKMLSLGSIQLLLRLDDQASKRPVNPQCRHTALPGSPVHQDGEVGVA
jgi:hypothetical protein